MMNGNTELLLLEACVDLGACLLIPKGEKKLLIQSILDGGGQALCVTGTGVVLLDWKVLHG